MSDSRATESPGVEGRGAEVYTALRKGQEREVQEGFSVLLSSSVILKFLQINVFPLCFSFFPFFFSLSFFPSCLHPGHVEVPQARAGRDWTCTAAVTQTTAVTMPDP